MPGTLPSSCSALARTFRALVLGRRRRALAFALVGATAGSFAAAALDLLAPLPGAAFLPLVAAALGMLLASRGRERTPGGTLSGSLRCLLEEEGADGREEADPA